MSFDKIKEYLSDFPQLQEEYNKLESEGYKAYHITIGTAYSEDFPSDMIEVLLIVDLQ